MTANSSSERGSVVLHPRRGALLAGHDNVLDVLVRVQAPDVPAMPARKRPQYRIAIVIDRSGSMAGEPLQEAKACARFIVDRLAADDVATIVTFDGHVRVNLAATTVGDRSAHHQAIDRIHEGGNTNLFGGWQQGAVELKDFAKAEGVQRVILLSDGCANEGITETHVIVDEVEGWANLGITTSTYGLGRSFNEDLMIAMGRAGRGNHYYGQTAQDLMEPFVEELDLLANLWMKEVRLGVVATPGVEVAVVNDYASIDGAQSWRLPDVAFGAEAWALLRVRVPASLVKDSAVPLLSVQVFGRDLEGGAIELPPQELSLAGLPAAAYAALAEDELVARRAAELDAAALLKQCREAAREGDWRRVQSLVAKAKDRFGENPWVAQVIEQLEALAREQDEARFSKEAAYSSTRMMNRLAQKAESSDVAAEMLAPSFLRRKQAQGKAQFVRRDEGDRKA